MRTKEDLDFIRQQIANEVDTIMGEKGVWGDLLAGGALIVVMVVGLFALIINSIPAK